MEQKDLNYYAHELGLKKIAEAEALKTAEAAQSAADDARDARIRAEEEFSMAVERVKNGEPADLDVVSAEAEEIEAILDDEPFVAVAAEAQPETAEAEEKPRFSWLADT